MTGGIIVFTHNAGLMERWYSLLSTHHQVTGYTDLSQFNYALHQHAPKVSVIHQQSFIRESETAVSTFETLRHGKQVMVLDDEPESDLGILLLQLGYRGYANSHIHEDGLMQAVNTVAKGDVWAPQSVIQAILKSLLRNVSPEAVSTKKLSLIEKLKEQLSPRECDSLDLVLKGLSNREIAHEMAISERTVKAHLKSIYQKSDTRNRVDLMLALQIKH